MILDKGQVSSLWLGRNPFGKTICEGNLFINLLAAFPGAAPWCSPQHHLFTIAMAVVIKQFRKVTNKLYKNSLIYQRLSETFTCLRNRFPK
jgi:hypothetical protein